MRSALPPRIQIRCVSPIDHSQDIPRPGALASWNKHIEVEMLSIRWQGSAGEAAVGERSRPWPHRNRRRAESEYRRSAAQLSRTCEVSACGRRMEAAQDVTKSYNVGVEAPEAKVRA